MAGLAFGMILLGMAVVGIGYYGYLWKRGLRPNMKIIRSFENPAADPVSMRDLENRS